MEKQWEASMDSKARPLVSAAGPRRERLLALQHLLQYLRAALLVINFQAMED